MEQNRSGRPSGIPPSMRAQAPRPQAHTAHSHATPPPKPTPPPPVKKSKVGFIIGLIALVAIAIVVTGIGTMMVIKNVATSSAVKTNAYQAVFLNNNMVYFGKISDINSEYIKISDIYYLQVQGQQNGQTQAANTAQSQLSLTKLGAELHGPEDIMYINKKEVLFWENLKADGKVTQAIKDYQSKNGK